MDTGPRLLLISILLIQISGFVFLWTKISESQRVAAPTPIVPIIDPESTIAAMKPPNEELLRESIQTILKDEIQAYLRQVREEKPRSDTATASTATPAARPRPRAKVNPQVALESHAIVDRALAAGVWTDNDNNALLRLSPQMSEAQRVELLEKLFGAINQKQLKAMGALPSL